MSGSKTKNPGQQSVMGVGSVVHEKSMLVYEGHSLKFSDIQNVARFQDQAKFIKKNYHHDGIRGTEQPERTSPYAKVFKFEIGGKDAELSSMQVIEILELVNWEKYKKEDRSSGGY